MGAEDKVVDLMAALDTSVREAKLARRHMEHGRSCSCLNDSAECCVKGCPCKVPNGGPSDG